MALRTGLSTEDMDRWAAALRATPEDPLELISWLVKDVRPYFPFQRALLVHGEQVAGEIRVTHLVTYGHNPQYIDQLSRTFDLKTRGCLTWWLAHRAPFCIDTEAPPSFATQFELDEIREFDLGCVGAHGVLNPTGSAGTYFSFSGISAPTGPWHLEALRLIAPMLNDLFLRHLAASTVRGVDHTALTPRQKDIVRLAARGLSGKSIARELAISEKTVRNQLTMIYEHLGVHDYRGMLQVIR